ncbi:MAG: hypothetical protein A3I77_05480 [Gammaproteobacteria bacterium RIFCSPLOWO2_02_FULL_42_14]|nr:MAG: hypothetical protein A3B71_02045 [Gammaproteobacteria bacterium RIFCSPHIGHO2_02_FULL_42_43]OGT29553.1 MAG: hypothetical protein A2624_06995 [Gammaproteobacteria bacterium RIFCSPHIGHO2_01_FULL_42_8]OGT51223.1 MAG: hypothetical protein A3E54_03235 [Gammaproteobacteria bacterium RIFCSPHIGHO2_12_FULL_41_25]OGT62984.1 MAG: hypothetical protein A3I77_05480 [Gammaproteobacteria bacterium RIFCSPLOWO2_02_FULL_42_14]OGT86117.1 MAG: hypothetical protein A3G86_03035 [Gammaproteobacteria bacterium R
MAKILISIPDYLAYRMKSTIPARQRSRLIARLLEAIIKRREKRLYEAALAVEKDVSLRHEMSQWDITTEDGLKTDESW